MEEKEYEEIMLQHVNRINPISIPREKILNALYPLKTQYRDAKNNNEKQVVLEEVQDLVKNFSDEEDIKDIISETHNKKEFGNYSSKPKSIMKTNAGVVSGKLGTTYINNSVHFEVDEDDLVINGGDLEQVDLVESGGNNYISAYNYKKILEKNKIDTVASNSIQELVSNIDQIENFDRKKIFNNIKNNIVSSGNLTSLVNDNIFGNRNFKEDFIESLMTASYKDLGLTISEQEIKNLDPTDDGKISLQDAIVIFGKLTEDKDQTIDYVAEYFTKFAEQNRTKPNLQDQEETGYDPYEFA